MERTGDRENQAEQTAGVKAQRRPTLCTGESRLTGPDVVQERVKSGEAESRQTNVPSCMSQTSALGRQMRLELCWREGARPVEGSGMGRWGGGANMQWEQGRRRPHLMPQALTG